VAIKILLDTDIGSDIDDAVCLAYLLANPECELIGITTVTSEPVKRAKLASVLCKIAGEDVPIYPGAAKPLLIPQLQTNAKQAAALKRWDHKKDFPTGETVEFMRSTIRENPGEIILLTIGPLTNIGLLFSIDPEIPSLLKGLVSMCGHFLFSDPHLPKTEWNAMGDYHASAIVYNSKIKYHQSIGLDVTSKVTMRPNEFKEKFESHDLLKPVLDFSKAWFNEWPIVTFHDPLAAVTIFDKKVCEFERGEITIEFERKNRKGMTIWNPGINGKHEIAVDVNPERFFRSYFDVFK
jgi:inosine-uridine nucleoside N-ribohydrolase